LHGNLIEQDISPLPRKEMMISSWLEHILCQYAEVKFLIYQLVIQSKKEDAERSRLLFPKTTFFVTSGENPSEGREGTYLFTALAFT
jgi:hypothetical protein